MTQLTHNDCCRLVKESIERGVQTLRYIEERLNKGKISPEIVAHESAYMKDVLCNINYYGAYLHGMMQMLEKLRDCGLLEEKRAKNGIPRAKGEMLVYNKSIIDLLLSDKANCERFLMGEYDIRFTDHERDKKGKLVKCRAYFAKRVVTYREV